MARPPKKLTSAERRFGTPAAPPFLPPLPPTLPLYEHHSVLGAFSGGSWRAGRGGRGRGACRILYILPSGRRADGCLPSGLYPGRRAAPHSPPSIEVCDCCTPIEGKGRRRGRRRAERAGAHGVAVKGILSEKKNGHLAAAVGEYNDRPKRPSGLLFCAKSNRGLATDVCAAPRVAPGGGNAPT